MTVELKANEVYYVTIYAKNGKLCAQIWEDKRKNWVDVNMSRKEFNPSRRDT
jgi:hypothetical protein